MTKSDPRLKMICDQYGPPPNWSRPPGFVSLVKIILEQQVSLASAMAHFNKLEGRLGNIAPESILELSAEEFRACHISQQKTKYLKILSEEVIAGRLQLDKLHELNEEDARKELTRLKGIGNWTADIYLMFCLSSPDIFPIGDIAVVNTMKELFGTNTQEEILNIAEKWRPHRTLATHFLWQYYLRKRKRSFPF